MFYKVTKMRPTYSRLNNYACAEMAISPSVFSSDAEGSLESVLDLVLLGNSSPEINSKFSLEGGQVMEPDVTKGPGEKMCMVTS